MDLLLSPETERQIAEKIESGEYSSADEVVRSALQALSRKEQDYARRVEALRAEIQKGLDDLDNGRHSLKGEAFERIRARRAERLRTLRHDIHAANDDVERNAPDPRPAGGGTG